MAIENWIDQIAKIFEISDGRGGTVRSYRVYERNEFPEALSDFPCAITYIVGYRPTYSAGGPVKGFYRGRTEFHLTPDVKKSNFPYLMRFPALIRNAMSANYQLGSRVDDFRFAEGVDYPVLGPVSLQYGSEAPHHGYVIEWEVKTDESGDSGFTFSA